MSQNMLGNPYQNVGLLEQQMQQLYPRPQDQYVGDVMLAGLPYVGKVRVVRFLDPVSGEEHAYELEQWTGREWRSVEKRVEFRPRPVVEEPVSEFLKNLICVS